MTSRRAAYSLPARCALLSSVAAAVIAMACDSPEAARDAAAERDGGGPSGQCTVDPYALLADPNLPARRLPGRMRLASSREPEDPSGMANDDEGQYVRRDGEQWVLMEHDGPGLVTRLWFTGREAGTRDQTYLDRAVLHLYVDGREVSLTPERDGIELGRLVSGELPAFPRPWVVDRVQASGALLVLLPIPFASSIRISVSNLPSGDLSFYYQIDWRELPASCAPASFDGTLPEDARASLREAEALWFVDERPCGATEAQTFDLTTSGEAVVEVEGPTVVRSIEVSAGSRDALDDVIAALEVDGVAVVETPLSRLLLASSPTQPGRSALTSLSPDGTAALRYPLPVRDRLRLRLHSASTAMVDTAICHDPGPVPPELGSLRVTCGEPVSAAVGENVVLLEARARGQLAGQFLVTDGPHPNFWFLEGDHEIVVDGAYAILGTGIEDYFGGAFYYQLGPSELHFSGASGRAALPEEGRSIVSQHRHHFLDTIPFDESFRFEYESYVAGTRFEHCTFWYEYN